MRGKPREGAAGRASRKNKSSGFQNPHRILLVKKPYESFWTASPKRKMSERPDRRGCYGPGLATTHIPVRTARHRLREPSQFLNGNLGTEKSCLRVE
jgi:hypothetical protein